MPSTSVFPDKREKVARGVNFGAREGAEDYEIFGAQIARKQQSRLLLQHFDNYLKENS